MHLVSYLNVLLIYRGLGFALLFSFKNDILLTAENNVMLIFVKIMMILITY